jgi:hypothetical protein
MEYFSSASCDHSSCVLVKLYLDFDRKSRSNSVWKRVQLGIRTFSIIFKLIRRISVVIGSLTGRESARRGEFARWTVDD